MIKFFNRMLFALVLAIGLMAVYYMSEQYVITNYLLKLGNEALDEENYVFFMPARFYKEEPIENFIYTYEERTFIIRLYEVARIQLVEGEYVVSDGLFFMMHQQEGAPLDTYFEVNYKRSDDYVIEYLGTRQFTLDFYSAIMQSNSRPILLKDDFLVNEQYLSLININITLEDETSFDIPVDIDFTTFTLKDQIDNYIQVNDNTPREPFLDVLIAPLVEVEDVNNLVIRNTIIYVVVALSLTVLIFTYRNKRLGRKKATEGLEKDISRIQENQDGKR
jgi:hypothetical protein